MIHVYYNSIKKCWSMKGTVRGKSKVIGYADKIYLKNCKFKVYENGRQKSLRLGHKTLHAYVSGDISEKIKIDNPISVKYDRHKCGSFYSDDGIVESADKCIMDCTNGINVLIERE